MRRQTVLVPALLVTLLLGAVAVWAFLKPPKSNDADPPTGPGEPSRMDLGWRLAFRIGGKVDPGGLASVVRGRLAGWAEGKAEVLPETDERYLHVGLARGVSSRERDRAKGLVTRLGILELRVIAPLAIEEAERRSLDREGADYRPKDGYRWVPQVRSAGLPTGPDRLLDLSGECFTGTDLDPGSLRPEPASFAPGWVVGCAMREDRRAAFADESARIKGRPLAILLDGRLLTAPIVQDRLDGPFRITGGGYSGFTREEAEDLCAALRAGPLPVELTLLAEEEIADPGKDPARHRNTCVNHLKQIGGLLATRVHAHTVRTSQGGRAFLLQVAEDVTNDDLPVFLCPGGPEWDAWLADRSDLVDTFRFHPENAPCGYRGPALTALRAWDRGGGDPIIWACCRNGFAGTDPYHGDGVCVLWSTGKTEFVPWAEMKGFEGGPVRVGDRSPDPRFRHLVD